MTGLGNDRVYVCIHDNSHQGDSPVFDVGIKLALTVSQIGVVMGVVLLTVARAHPIGT